MPSRPRPPQRRSTDTRGLRLIVATLAALTLAPACVDDPGEPDSNHDNLGETHSSLTTANGLTMNGLGANGIGVNGITLNGIDLNGIHLNGIHLNGIHLNGIHLNGIHLNGIHLNGIHLNGIHLNGIHLNGIHLNGIHLNGIHLNGIDLFGTVMAALDATSQAAVERSLVYMARCALSPGQTMTYYTLAGTTRTVTGVSGLDPTWLDGVPNLGKADVVATCVQNLAISAGDTVTVELTDLLNFKKVLQYLVECALPQGHSITYYDETDLPVTVAGSLGLAPEWEASTPTAAGQRYVSACLAARTNANGQTVRISLRGPSLTAGAPSPLSASDTERASFNWNEGAFWGDLFSATPSIKTCVGQGNGVAGRLCTVDGTCGFTNVGQCSQPSVCATQNPGDGAYTGCLGTAEVVSTYLPIGTSTASGTAHTCVRKNDGQIVCHGQNGLGQLGDGTTTDQLLAAVAPLLPSVPFLEVVGSQTSAYGRTADGALYGWGQNHLVPSRIAAAGVVSALSSGGSFLPQNPNNICVLRADGTVACQAADSRLGPGALVERTELGAEVARVAASNHACALKSTGDLYCWGSNQRGQVGDGTTVDVATAVKVASTVTDLALGASHTCVRTIDQRLWCWGDNGYGQLG
ncbi:MAG: Alpha-tubulin suppressor and related protein-like protein, partial [Deltaproteobacteria bacterium]|nr:Alpha-tubulin suppressor and related protein-like protein [Deltaproteobacteria bacterium]